MCGRFLRFVKYLIRVLGENKEIADAIIQSPLMGRQAESAYTAAKAELDEIEAERIALLVELDKVKANYQQTKNKMLAELTKQKQKEIIQLDKRLINMKTGKDGSGGYPVAAWRSGAEGYGGAALR